MEEILLTSFRGRQNSPLTAFCLQDQLSLGYLLRMLFVGEFGSFCSSSTAVPLDNANEQVIVYFCVEDLGIC